MSSWVAIRRGLVERGERLERRLAGIRDDLEQVGGSEGKPLFPSLQEIVSAARHELGLVHGALERMDRDAYGLCEDCAREIGHQRLELLPYATRCERCALGLDLDALRQLRVQHLGLRQLVHGIERVLEAATRGSTARASALALLGDLERELPEHFALEERGGYFADVVEAAPRLSQRADALLAEHATLRELSHQVHEDVRAAGDAPVAWRRGRARFGRLRARLLAHEDAENQLVREAFMNDLSASD